MPKRCTVMNQKRCAWCLQFRVCSFVSAVSLTSAYNPRTIHGDDPQERTMNRERALKVVLVLVGLFFLAGFYFLAISLWHAKWHAEQSEAEPMFLSVYITLGIFLLLSARNPSSNRSLARV